MNQHPDALTNNLYIGRFAPSPTGPLHIGSLLAAVGSYLQAKVNNGKWLLRIEDLDPPRIAEGAVDAILTALETYGLYWDEILYQSNRLDAYAEAIEYLENIDQIYGCTCTRKQIEEIAQPGVAGMVYPGTCRDKSREIHKPHALRIRCPNNEIKFEDKLLGVYQQHLQREMGDFVMRRADGLYNYQLAVVVDDAFQNVTEIVRGSDLLVLTPGQIHLQRCLDLPTPSYIHLPVIVDNEGHKLSKQTGAKSLSLKDPLPALHQVMTYLGHPPTKEIARAGLEEFWAWALENWSLVNIPAEKSVRQVMAAANT